jgi:hypothetical protein
VVYRNAGRRFPSPSPSVLICVSECNDELRRARTISFPLLTSVSCTTFIFGSVAAQSSSSTSAQSPASSSSSPRADRAGPHRSALAWWWTCCFCNSAARARPHCFRAWHDGPYIAVVSPRHRRLGRRNCLSRVRPPFSPFPPVRRHPVFRHSISAIPAARSLPNYPGPAHRRRSPLFSLCNVNQFSLPRSLRQYLHCQLTQPPLVCLRLASVFWEMFLSSQACSIQSLLRPRRTPMCDIGPSHF